MRKSFIFCVIVLVEMVFSTKLAIPMYTLEITDLSSGKTVFQTSTEFLRMECGSQIHPAQIRISEPLDACQKPPAPPTQLPAIQWALLVTVDDDNDDCNLKTKFVNAARAGYSAIILATCEKLSSVMDITTKSKVWHLDVYLVNRMDVRVLSQYAYPQNNSSFVVPTPNVGTGKIESGDPQFCEVELKKPFYERVYYTKHTSKVDNILENENVANFWTLLRSLPGRVVDLIVVTERFLWISLVLVLCLFIPDYWAAKQEIKKKFWEHKAELCNKQDDRDMEYKKRVKAVENLSALQTLLCYFLEDAFQCTICKEILLDGVETACKHQFCGGCLRRWRWEHENCPLCRHQFSGEDEPTPCKALNAHLDELFKKLPRQMMKERILKRKAFRMMTKPEPNEFTSRFDRIADFIQYVFGQNGGENRRIRIQLPNENGNGESEEYVQISRNEDGEIVYQFYNELEDSTSAGDAAVEAQPEGNNSNSNVE